eukprot:662941-Hanusia_phi.AAC.1
MASDGIMACCAHHASGPVEESGGGGGPVTRRHCPSTVAAVSRSMITDPAGSPGRAGPDPRGARNAGP